MVLYNVSLTIIIHEIPSFIKNETIYNGAPGLMLDFFGSIEWPGEKAEKNAEIFAGGFVCSKYNRDVFHTIHPHYS